jgi:hypothetical protein
MVSSHFPRLTFLVIINDEMSAREGTVKDDPLLSDFNLETQKRGSTRREWLERAAGLICLVPLAALHPKGAMRVLLGEVTHAQSALKFSVEEEAFLDDVQRACSLFFWEQADVHTGMVKDRSVADGYDSREIGSIASTGFGLTALCIADQRGYFPSAKTRSRVRDTLRFLWKDLRNEHGFYYHWGNIRTGERIWDSEVSSIDTALLLCGVLTCRQHFNDPEIHGLATQIYERVDWPWMLNRGTMLSHGWKPETGFLKPRWDTYNELMMIYLLGLGSSTHPLPAETWESWARPIFEYEGIRYIGSNAPLFVHDYSQAWFDFRGKSDRHADYFENSVLATQAHRLFCLQLQKKFPDYSEDLWGITASDSAHGYVVWGGPPSMGPIDGTLVPSAAGGSLPFLPSESVHTLRVMKERFGKRAWKRYGFVDAFNPQTGWYDPDVIGINLGITTVMAENARSQFVWNTFMKNEEMRRGMDRAGFHPNDATGFAEVGGTLADFDYREATGWNQNR